MQKKLSHLKRLRWSKAERGPNLPTLPDCLTAWHILIRLQVPNAASQLGMTLFNNLWNKSTEYLEKYLYY